MNLQVAATNWIISITNNLVKTSGQPTAAGSSAPLYAINLADVSTAQTSVTISGNALWGNATSPEGASYPNAGQPIITVCCSGSPAYVPGSNTFVDPAFTNATDLLTNRVSTPTCTSYENSAQCMGYDASTSTLTALTPIADLVPTAGSAIGKGFQVPSTTCAANSDYPTWLKGIVYLHHEGGGVLRSRSGLVTKPCGL